MTTFLLHQLVTRSCERNPSGTAIVGPNTALTYEQLEELSNQLARQLREDGVSPGDRVGVLVAKSAEAVAALVGAQKAGAAYVPVDPYSPAHRALYILGNCSVRALVTSFDKLAKIPLDKLVALGLKTIILLDQEAPVELTRWSSTLPIRTLNQIRETQSKQHFAMPLTENDLAYILYTSGSTGEPKGVMISHRNSLAFVNWCFDTFEVKSEDRVSNHAPFHFDLSIFDLFCSLKAGATVILVPHSVSMFPAELAGWIAEKEISIWYSVPSALIELVEHGSLEQRSYKRLRTVLFAGEAFPIKYLRRLTSLWPQPAYYNLYGPTETNVCTYYRVQPRDLEPARTEPVCIGEACANTHVVAVNDHGQEVMEGGEGELYVRGPTVMKGYWGRPQDTSKVLVANFVDPRYEFLYRTGDIVRRLPGNNYQYLGRRDKMIKSRGYRIELGEIEAALYAHPHVLEAAVVALPDPQIGARIKAYVVVGDSLTEAELKKFCSQRLPRYMMPEQWEMRADLPKTSTGKIDRASLEKST
jgi:amino acid adenylation domain-containing protein